ncbi:MFS transporter [Cupriavidus sp. H39]|uniref:MFS transporter n=1 Tax=Cupriavidus sp. H39 TaxID=3401635 RepID=UPI003D02BE95
MTARQFQKLVHQRKQRLLIAVICAMVGMEFLENGMFVFASTHILGAIGAAPQEFALVQMAYAVGNMLMVALQQWLTRHFGYRHYLLLALALFGLGNIGCALATNLPELIAARMSEGMGGGAFFLSTRVLIPLLFSASLRPLASRCFMLSIFGMGMVAPLLSATLVDGWGWQWVFWIMLPIAAAAAVGVRWLLPRHLGKSAQPVRWSLVPIVMFVLAAGLVQWAFSEARYELVDRPELLALAILVGITLLGVFSIHQWRHDEPLLHLRELTNPGFLAGLSLLAMYYFIVNFSNYLFPQFAQQGLGIPVVTTGWLNSFAGAVSFAAVVLYIRYSARVANKRAMMMAGCLCMAAAAWWMAALPPDASITALYGALAVKGLFGVLMILPVSALTWRALGDAHFARGYQTKNVMRQMMVSMASSVAAVALQNGRVAQYSDLTGRISPSNPAAVQWLDQAQHRFEQLGYSASQAHGAAFAQLSALVDKQAIFIACQHLYHWIAAIAAAAAVIVMAQRQLR